MKQFKNKLTNSEMRGAIAFCRTMKDKYWRLREEQQSLLLGSIQAQSKLGEEEIEKRSLLAIIKIMCKYMRCHSLYVYYRDSLSELLVKLNSLERQHGDINNANRQD